MTIEAKRAERYKVLSYAAKQACQSALDAHGTIGEMPPASAAWDVICQFEDNTHPVFSERMPRFFAVYYAELVRQAQPVEVR